MMITSLNRPSLLVVTIFVFLLSILLSVSVNASPEYQALLATYNQNNSKMSNGDFKEPLTIKSSFSDDLATGEIHALIDTDFSSVSSRLVNTQQWCDMLVLHINIKACYGDGQTTEGTSSVLVKNGIRLYVGRNFYQPVEDAYVMDYKLTVVQRSEDYLKTTLVAEDGPFGTSEYLLEFEAIPLSKNSTFIHFKYSYHYGFLARVALKGYLATLGRKKVGFTINSYDEESKPVYVKGVQGIVERNSMRYYIAIRAFLDTFELNNENWSKRIEHWYQMALPYKRQLLEIEDRKYLQTKQEEFEKRVSLETALAVTE